jgi:drug/metabolite transporter (DMT)-like permease
MVLSVIVYNHTLTLGQWFGAAVVFAGIGVEAWVKRKGALLTIPLRLLFDIPFLVRPLQCANVLDLPL